MTRLADQIEIANPQHPHCATVLVLDTSGSMANQGKIDQLNDGLAFFREDVARDELARKRVDLAVVTFGETVKVAHDFSSIERFTPPRFQAEGETPMGSAILRAVDLVEQRKREYKDTGIDYYRPWIFMVTDGEPTDMRPGDALWHDVTAKIATGERDRKFLFFAVGVEPANMDLLKRIASREREPVQLARGRFREMFVWISKSQQRVSASRPGEEVVLDNPVAPNGWGHLPN